MTITIEGLNRRQAMLADIMWAMNGRDQVERFIQSLPALQQAEARTVMHMMIAAVYDDVEDVAFAQQVLKPYRLTGL